MKCYTACAALILLLVSTASAYETTDLDFVTVLQKAVKNSYELKISDATIDISKAALKETKSLYYPKMTAQFNSEYLKDLTDVDDGTTEFVGESAIVSGTKFQNSFSLKLTYDLYDFGIRENRLLIAKKDIALNRFMHSQNLKDLKVKVLELYTDTLLTYKELKTNKKALPFYRELFHIQERLNKAGKIAKTAVADEAIRVARTIDNIDSLRMKLKETLEAISFYTLESYDVDDVVMTGFAGDQSGEVRDMDYKKSPEYRAYELAIENKKTEIKNVKKERFPKFSIYSSYRLYGMNSEKYFESLDDLSQTNYSVGFFATILLFDGFRNSARVEKIKYEIKRLELSKNERMAEVNNEYKILRDKAVFNKVLLDNRKELTARIDDKLSMVERLSAQQISDRSALLNQKIELIHQGAELEKTLVIGLSTLKKLNILSEVYN